jgi:hypothetical protein
MINNLLSKALPSKVYSIEKAGECQLVKVIFLLVIALKKSPTQESSLIN